MSICIACAYPSDGNLLCIDCQDGIAWAKSQRLQQDFSRRVRTVTDWGQIACEMLGLLERSPEMRLYEGMAWAYLLNKIHPADPRRSEFWSEDVYKKRTRELLCEYLSDHLGDEAKPSSKPTADNCTDWLFVATEIVQFFKDNPKIKQVEPELWEWMLNQTYPLPPNHAPTARNMTKAVLENFMGDYGPTVQMILEYEGRKEADELAKKQLPPGLVELPISYEEAQKQGLEPAEGLSDYEKRADYVEPAKPTTTRKRGRQ